MQAFNSFLIYILVFFLACEFLSRIVCQKDAECELQESDPQTSTCSDGGVTLPENYESFAENLCKTECAKSDTEEDDAKRCRFWRFVSWTSLKVVCTDFYLKDHLGTTKTCSLMSDTQCTVFDPCFGHCHCGDQGCPDDTIPAPPGMWTYLYLSLILKRLLKLKYESLYDQSGNVHLPRHGMRCTN